jgi:hypothetical protein
MSLCNPSRASNTIHLPSGDQRGDPGDLCPEPSVVSAIGFLPSESLRQISSKPLRSDKKAIHLPSGENCGLESARVEGKSGRGPEATVGVAPGRTSNS